MLPHGRSEKLQLYEHDTHFSMMFAYVDLPHSESPTHSFSHNSICPYALRASEDMMMPCHHNAYTISPLLSTSSSDSESKSSMSSSMSGLSVINVLRPTPGGGIVAS